MKITKFFIWIAAILFCSSIQTQAQTFDGPLRVHPLNGRYFTDNTGKAIFLTGSHTWSNFQEIGLPGDPPFDWNGYFPEGGTATLDLRGTEGEYEVEWFIPTLNRTMKGPEPLKSGDFQVVEAPFASGDSRLYLKRK